MDLLVLRNSWLIVLITVFSPVMRCLATRVLDVIVQLELVEELCACRMPYVCPRGKPVMIFTSTRELDRKFARN